MLVLVLGLASAARAVCNLIPAAVQELRSTRGTVDRPVATPGSRVTVRVDLACDPANPGFSPVAGDNRVLVVFTPPAGASHQVLVPTASIQVEDCSPTRCDTLRFTVPDTDADLPPVDGLGRTGPARLLVQRSDGTSVAEIGPLFQETLSCDDKEPETLFRTFTVLPPPNVFADLVSGASQRVLSTLDGGNDLLIPFDFRAVLPAGSGAPVARIVQGVGRLQAFSSDPQKKLVEIPSPFFVRAFSPIGRPVPPILEVANDGQVIFGSVDADESVLRIARVDPKNPAAPPIYDLTDRLVSGAGPIVISDFTLESRETAPLDALRPSAMVVGIGRDEALEGNLNGDADAGDNVVQVLDVASGAGSNTRQALFALDQAGRTKPGLAAADQFVAFLESEAAQGEQPLNGDGDASDQIFRTFTAGGSDLTASSAAAAGVPLDVSIDPAPVVNGSSVAVSGPFVFFRTREADGASKQTERVSGAPLLPTNAAIEPAPSSDGRRVAFVTYAGLVPEDRNGLLDVYQRDRTTGALVLVSPAQVGAARLVGALGPPATSGDGGIVAWTSLARAAGSTTARATVFARNLATGAAEIVSGSSTQDANGDSELPSLSGDGRFVVFDSVATNLVGAADANGAADVFLVDRTTGGIQRISQNAQGQAGSGASSHARISTDGRFVAFQSAAPDLVPGDTNGKSDVFVYDRAEGTLDLASRGNGGAPLDGSSTLPAISADGRFVAFFSDAQNAGASGPAGVAQVYVYDRIAQGLERVSQGRAGAAANGGAAPALAPSISDDGRRIAFVSAASNLVPGDSNGLPDCFVVDRLGKVPERVNVGAGGVQANGPTYYGCVLSLDGRTAAFDSLASNLVAGDNNGKADVFVRVPATVEDLNGDGDARDTVLQVFDTGARALAPEAHLAASQVSVSDGRAALLVSESQQFGTDGNGDGDEADRIVEIYDASTKHLDDTGIAGDQVSLAGSLLCFTSPDEMGGGAATLFGLALGGSAQPLGCTASAVASTGQACVILSSDPCGVPAAKSAAPASAPTVPYLVTPGTVPSVTRLAEAAEDFVVGDHLVALRTCESTVARDLNGDGDTQDCVLQIYDLNGAVPNPIPTGYATRVCDLPGCDPFFEPYRVRGDTASFLVFEGDQSGPAAPGGVAGCLASSPPGGCDLTGDGDAGDAVIVVFDVRSREAQVFQVDPQQKTGISPFPETQISRTVLTVQQTERQAGFDVNGDGVIDDTKVVLLVGDSDEDGALDYSQSASDSCREDPNAAQTDADRDGLGDGVCDPNSRSVLPGTHPCDVDANGSIDRTDVDFVFRDRGMKARASDARDADGDGEITLLDAAACADRCSNPDCSPVKKACGLLGIEILPAVAAALVWRRRRSRRHGRQAALLGAALLLLLGGAATDAGALSMDVLPVRSEVRSGDPVALEVTIYGLGDGEAPSLRGFDLDFGFDPAVISFVAASYGDQLGSPGDSSAFQATTYDAGAAYLSVASVSLLPSDFLISSQPPEFGLVTLHFRALAPGTTTVALTRAVLSDTSGRALLLEGIGSADVLVAVPEPGSALLLAAGLAALVRLRRGPTSSRRARRTACAWPTAPCRRSRPPRAS